MRSSRVALTLLAAAVLAAPAGAASARCPKGTTALGPAGKPTACLPRKTGEPAELARAAAAHPRGGRRNGAAIRLVQRATAFAGERLAAGEPVLVPTRGGARAAGAAARRSAPAPAGIAGAPASLGRVTSVREGPGGEVTATFASRGQSLRMTAGDRELTIDVRDRTGAGSWASFTPSAVKTPTCPTAAGDVPARFDDRVTFGEAVVSHGRSSWTSATIELEGSWLGHVGASGRAEVFDASLRAAVELRGATEIAATGKVLRREPTRTFRLALDRAGVAVGTAGTSLLGAARLRGPRGTRMDAGERVVAGLLAKRAAVALDHVSDELRTGDRRWFEERRCARVVVSTVSPEQVDRGASATWGLHVIDATGARAADARWVAQSDCGAVTPGSGGGAAFSATVSDAAGRWGWDPPTGACLTAEVTSTAGRAAVYRGTVDPRPPADLRIRMTVHYSEDMGTGIAPTNVVADGTVTLPAGERQAEGAGFWDGTEWDRTIGNPCGADMSRSRSISGTTTTGVTRNRDGTLSVALYADERPLSYSWLSVVPVTGGTEWVSSRKPFCGEAGLALAFSDIRVDVTPVPAA